MALKFKLTPDEHATVDEAIKAFYKDVGDGDKKVFVLQVEGAVSNDRLAEVQAKVKDFRKTNGRLADRLKVFTEHAGIEVEEDATPEDLADLLKEKRSELERSLGGGKGGKEEKDIEKQVTARVEAFKTAAEADKKKLTEQIKKLTEERDGHFKQLEKLSIEQEVIASAAKRGLRPTAHIDIVTRARQVFSFKEGKVRALSEDGETPVFGPDGDKELTISDWVDKQATEDAVHLFESNSGGGAAGGSGGAGRANGHGPNPWKKETWNITRQFELGRKDPATAKRLKQEAGR